MGEPADGGAEQALIAAGLDRVARTGTSLVTLDEIAADAGIGADVAAELFPSANELLVRGAMARCIEELRVAPAEGPGSVPTASGYARHFARHREFYRAMRIGEVAALLDARMAAAVAPLVAHQIRTVVGSNLTGEQIATMTADVTAESFEVTNRWIVEAPDGATPESLYMRLEDLVLRQLEAVRTPPQA